MYLTLNIRSKQGVTKTLPVEHQVQNANFMIDQTFSNTTLVLTRNPESFELVGTMQKESSMVNKRSTKTGSISDIRNYDVLCARDKSSYNHIGNRRFRVLIQYHFLAYDKAGRSQKTRIVDDLHYRLEKEVCARFIRKQAGKWVELSRKEVRNKIAHAFRDMRVSKLASNDLTTTTVDDDLKNDWLRKNNESPPDAPRRPAPGAGGPSVREAVVRSHQVNSFVLGPWMGSMPMNEMPTQTTMAHRANNLPIGSLVQSPMLQANQLQLDALSFDIRRLREDMSNPMPETSMGSHTSNLPIGSLVESSVFQANQLQQASLSFGSGRLREDRPNPVHRTSMGSPASNQRVGNLLHSPILQANQLQRDSLSSGIRRLRGDRQNPVPDTMRSSDELDWIPAGHAFSSSQFTTLDLIDENASENPDQNVKI